MLLGRWIGVLLLWRGRSRGRRGSRQNLQCTTGKCADSLHQLMARGTFGEKHVRIQLPQFSTDLITKLHLIYLILNRCIFFTQKYAKAKNVGIL